MARVTVEDCIQKVDNRFELVMLAAFRANKINAGAPITVEREKDKPPVIALREIAEGTIKVDWLKDLLIKHHQTNFEIDKVDNENLNTEAFFKDEEDPMNMRSGEYIDEQYLANMDLSEEENLDNSEYTDGEEDSQ